MKYSSNINSVIKELKEEFEKNQTMISALTKEIATSVRATNLSRIHNEGLDENDTPIGHYNSTTPIYINPKKSPRKFATKGKTGKTTFENGKAHKTGFFASYSAFRSSIGRETSFVNLQLSGKLMKSYNLSATGKEYVVGFTSDYGSQIAAGMEEKYGKQIWGVSASDEKAIDAIMIRYSQKK